MLIDHFMPAYQFAESRHRIVRATPEQTWAALRSLDFAKVPSAFMRLGLAVGRRVGRLGTKPPARLTFDNLEDYGRIKLGEEAGSEILVGGIGKLGRWAPELVAPGEFAEFRRPGYVKGVASFSVRPYDAERTLLSYETRAGAEDERARRRLRRLAPVLKVLGLRLMDAVLLHVAEAAERAAGEAFRRAA